MNLQSRTISLIYSYFHRIRPWIWYMYIFTFFCTMGALYTQWSIPEIIPKIQTIKKFISIYMKSMYVNCRPFSNSWRLWRFTSDDRTYSLFHEQGPVLQTVGFATKEDTTCDCDVFCKTALWLSASSLRFAT
jgi:hypothetical protein